MRRRIEIEILTEDTMASKVRIGDTELWLSNKDIEEADISLSMLQGLYNRLRYKCRAIRRTEENRYEFEDRSGNVMEVWLSDGSLALSRGVGDIKIDLTPSEVIACFHEMSSDLK